MGKGTLMLVAELASAIRDIACNGWRSCSAVSVLSALIVGTPHAHAAPPWAVEQKLVASDGAPDDTFGGAVAISGTVAVVGASEDDDLGANSGSVYVFQRVGGVWSQVAELHASDGAAGDRFGSAVAFDGTTIVVGAGENDNPGVDSGSAYVFRLVRGEWTETARLTPTDGAPGDRFGTSVAVSGDTAVVGAARDDDRGVDSGSVYFFDRAGSAWPQTAKLTAADGAANDQFGIAIALDANRACVGAHQDDDLGFNSGSVYIIDRVGGVWSQAAKIVADDGAAGDLFGSAVGLSVDTVIVGAHRKDNFTGAAYVFRKIHFNWVQSVRLVGADTATSDFFGISVAVSGDDAIVGANGNADQGLATGSAYLFERSNGLWNEIAKLFAPDGASLDLFGSAVAINGDSAIVGSTFDDETGSARVYRRVACVADFNGDDTVDFFDIAAFLGAFAALDPAADCTTDGLFDFFDVLAFLSAFSVGCP